MNSYLVFGHFITSDLITFIAFFSKSKTAYDVNSGIDLIKEFMIHGNLSPESIKTVEVYRAIAVAVKETPTGAHVTLGR